LLAKINNIVIIIKIIGKNIFDIYNGREELEKKINEPLRFNVPDSKINKE